MNSRTAIGRPRCVLACLLFLGAATMALRAQPRPYIGYTYPAGGQQGTTFQIKLGGQALDDVTAVTVTGAGVSAGSIDYYRRLNPQETQLLKQQINWLKSRAADAPAETAPSDDENPQATIDRIEKRLSAYVQTPACAALASLVFAEVTIAPDAAPGQRELRLVTARGVSNPLVFDVGQLPEHTREPMLTARVQQLGKEEQALRHRPADEVEARVTLPCTVNGQIASGEVNRYRFAAQRGRKLVFAVRARQLIPFVADAVPGWFQPVITLRDTHGRELAFADDYRFKPDPVMFYEVPTDGDYVIEITDAIHRGREDFVYRMSLGELPWITSVFPAGGNAGTPMTPQLDGWNLLETTLQLPPKDAGPGIHSLVTARQGFLSNPVPFAFDTLPEQLEHEPNDTAPTAQAITLPVNLNGRIDPGADRDVFQFQGNSNDTIVVEVQARRLGSPVDSVIQLTDEAGRVLAFDDDHENLCSGIQTHQADSWFMIRLPANGLYRVQVTDTARHGGAEFVYRLRVSRSRPDFDLRVVPSSLGMRQGAGGRLTVYVQRKDGFAGPVKVELQDPPPGFFGRPLIVPPGQNTAQFNLKAPADPTAEPVSLSIVGRAKIDGEEVVHAAVPAEDRMQAFLWRHLVPAAELPVMVFDPSHKPPPKRPLPARPTASTATNAVEAATAAKPKFSKTQIARRLRELNLLFEEGLLTDEFYLQNVAECEAQEE